ncbi:thioredoxin family protein [Microbacterium sp. LTA6]|uniref:thioredoxin n=1 Tax=unclassified Microbacterium TaxID=2609290 RepID=UPI0031394BBB
MRGAATRIAIVTGAITAFLLAGCAPMPSDEPSSPASVEASDPAPSEPVAPAVEPSADDDAPITGVYMDYRDGVIEATPGTKVLFFHATWCPQCRALDEQLRNEGSPDGVTVFKVDYDDRVDLRQQYGVTLQTTVVYVGDDGEKLSSAVLYDEPSIESLLAAAP